MAALFNPYMPEHGTFQLPDETPKGTHITHSSRRWRPAGTSFLENTFGLPARKTPRLIFQAVYCEADPLRSAAADRRGGPGRTGPGARSLHRPHLSPGLILEMASGPA